MEMGYFLFGNKLYFTLTTGQENSVNSEQEKRNIDFVFTMILDEKSVIMSSKMNYKNS